MKYALQKTFNYLLAYLLVYFTCVGCHIAALRRARLAMSVVTQRIRKKDLECLSTLTDHVMKV